MSADDVAVWLIGIGSIVVFLGLVAGSQRPYEGLSFRGPLSTRADRARFAIESTGATFVAVGSALLAVTSPPALAFALIVAISGYLTLHVLMAWKLRQYWQDRAALAARAARAEDANDHVRRQASVAANCASWRWCLTHPFNDQAWPGLEPTEG